MFYKTLGVFVMFALVGLLVLIKLYDINKDSAQRYIIILSGGFWLIALKILWDFMWFVF